MHYSEMKTNVLMEQFELLYSSISNIAHAKNVEDNLTHKLELVGDAKLKLSQEYAEFQARAGALIYERDAMRAEVGKMMGRAARFEQKLYSEQDASKKRLQLVERKLARKQKRIDTLREELADALTKLGKGKEELAKL